jgi:hypothetical protein
MMRDGAGRTCVWWQVRHWWYNHVSGPLGSKPLVRDYDEEIERFLAGDIGCPGLDDFDDGEERG